jgi:hypothetical protein
MFFIICHKTNRQFVSIQRGMANIRHNNDFEGMSKYNNMIILLLCQIWWLTTIGARVRNGTGIPFPVNQNQKADWNIQFRLLRTGIEISSCSACRRHFTLINLNNGCGTSLGNLVIVYHHIGSNIFGHFTCICKCNLPAELVELQLAKLQFQLSLLS